MQNATNKQTSDLMQLTHPQVWDTELAFQHLQSLGKADTKRTAERRLHELAFLPQALSSQVLQDELGRPANQVVLQWSLNKARSQRKLVLFAQLHELPTGQPCLHANDARGGRYWLPLIEVGPALHALEQLQQHIGKDIAIYPHGALVGQLRKASLNILIYTPCNI